MSIDGGRPATRSATIFPVIGAALIPTWPWPKGVDDVRRGARRTEHRQRVRQARPMAHPDRDAFLRINTKPVPTHCRAARLSAKSRTITESGAARPGDSQGAICFGKNSGRSPCRRCALTDGRRYASEVTDEEWALVEGFLPRPRKLGRPRTTEMREVVNALLYMLTTGCQWRLLPKEFPPFSTVQRFFYRWREAGLWQTINHSLVMQAREASGREASPTAGIIDTQSVKTTEGAGPRGYDAGKRSRA